MNLKEVNKNIEKYNLKKNNLSKLLNNRTSFCNIMEKKKFLINIYI